MAHRSARLVYAGEVGTRLASFRVACGLSPETLCAELQTSARTLRDYEAGRNVPGGFAIFELAHALGITADWILGIPPVRKR